MVNHYHSNNTKLFQAETIPKDLEIVQSTSRINGVSIDLIVRNYLERLCKNVIPSVSMDSEGDFPLFERKSRKEEDGWAKIAARLSGRDKGDHD